MRGVWRADFQSIYVHENLPLWIYCYIFVLDHNREFIMKKLPKDIESVSIRIDFFSKPMFYDMLIDKLNDTDFSGMKYYSRLLTDVEMQRIDIDSVAQNLSVSLEELVSKRVCLYTGETQSLKVEAYISEYFICLYFEKTDKSDFSEKERLLKYVFDNLKEMGTIINGQNFSYRTNSHIQADGEFIRTELNSDYIKIPDGEGFTNARYADLFVLDEGRMDVNLIRDVMKIESPEGDFRYDILISAIANRRIDNERLEELDFEGLASTMECANVDKINMCYRIQ